MTQPVQSGDPELWKRLKAQVWEALGKGAPLPDFNMVLNDLKHNHDITPVEMNHLLQLFATLVIWDVYNIEMPSEKKLLPLKEMGPHYQIYDRGSCLVATPKELFSHERTLEEALQAARVLASEAYQRNWTIEFDGYFPMARAAWVELQALGEKHGRQATIIHYTPSSDDLKLYSARIQTLGLTF